MSDIESQLRAVTKAKNADARILKSFETAIRIMQKSGAKPEIVEDMLKRYHEASVKILNNAVQTKESLNY